ncbi:hypothetical protein GCM10018790_37060 [Kitasatospora xanthocidica]|nr:hypothetical protein GCM10018790_37060 [Kitasatospora xanthocidica]
MVRAGAVFPGGVPRVFPRASAAVVRTYPFEAVAPRLRYNVVHCKTFVNPLLLAPIAPA